MGGATKKVNKKDEKTSKPKAAAKKLKNAIGKTAASSSDGDAEKVIRAKMVEIIEKRGTGKSQCESEGAAASGYQSCSSVGGQWTGAGARNGGTHVGVHTSGGVYH